MKRLLLLPLSVLATLAFAPFILGAAAAEVEPAPMSIQFPQRHASLVGPRALVLAECSGMAAGACEGTLVLNGVGGAHKVPYAIMQGQSQFLAVPLGDGADRGRRARVVARTLQLAGGSVRTSSVLRLR